MPTPWLELSYFFSFPLFVCYNWQKAKDFHFWFLVLVRGEVQMQLAIGKKGLKLPKNNSGCCVALCCMWQVKKLQARNKLLWLWPEIQQRKLKNGNRVKRIPNLMPGAVQQMCVLHAPCCCNNVEMCECACVALTNEVLPLALSYALASLALGVAWHMGQTVRVAIYGKDITARHINIRKTIQLCRISSWR